MTSPLARPTTHYRERFRMGFDFPNPGTGGAGTGASCVLTADTNANMADADSVTLEDGVRKVIYEYDKSANGVTAGHISVTAGTTAATVAANFRTAILANQPELSVTDNGDGTLSIANKWLGAAGNQTNSKSSSSALAITNFTGGVNPSMSSSLTTDTTVKLHKVKGRALRIARAHLDLPLGLAGHASNFCNFKLLKGASTVAANWSTSTGAESTITADTPVELTLSGTAASLDLSDGDQLSLFIDVTGTTTVPAGRIVVEGYEL